MGDRLRGRNAVVTGAGRGIGRGIALALAEEGANVVVCDLGCETTGTGADKAPAEAVALECQALGAQAVAYYGDVADFKSAEGMVRSCVDSFGRIDILCNIAGNFILNEIPSISEREWDSVIAVHVKGTFNLTRHATPLMKEQRYGRIINCASHTFTGLGPTLVGHASYITAKGGIVSFTYATAKELGRYGITCNAFTPGVWTRLSEEWRAQSIKAGLMPKERSPELSAAASQLEKYGDPKYIAPLVTYLASDTAGDVNGCLFRVEAGKLGIYSRPDIVRHVLRDPEKEGRWSFEELEKLVPEELLVDYVNPAPPQPDDS